MTESAAPATGPAPEAQTPAVTLYLLDNWYEEKAWRVASATGPEEVSVSLSSSPKFPHVAADSSPFYVLDGAPPVADAQRNDYLPVSRPLAIYHWFAKRRPQLASEPNLLILSVGMSGAVLARISDGIVVKEESVPDLSLREICRLFRGDFKNDAIGRYLSEYPDKVEVFWDNFCKALLGEFGGDDGPESFSDAPELDCCAEVLGSHIRRFDADGVCGRLLLADWAAVPAVRQGFSANGACGAEWDEDVSPFEYASRGFFARTFNDMHLFRDAAAKVLEICSDGHQGKVGDRLWHAVQTASREYNKPEAYLGILDVTDRNRGLAQVRRKFLAAAGLEPFSPEGGTALPPERLDDYEIDGAQLAPNYLVAVKMGGHIEITKAVRPGYRSTGGGRVVKKPVVNVQLVEPEVWKQARSLLDMSPAVPPGVRPLLSGILSGQFAPERPDYAAVMDMLDFLRVECEKGTTPEQRRTELKGRRGWWMNYLLVRDIEVHAMRRDEIRPEDALKPTRVGIGLEIEPWTAGSQQLKVPQAPDARHVPALAGRMFADAVLQIGYRNEKTGRPIRSARVVVVSELERLEELTYRVLKQEDDADAADFGLNELDRRGREERRKLIGQTLSEMQAEAFDGVRTRKGRSDREGVLRLLERVQGTGGDLRHYWMTFLGLAEFAPQQTPSGRRLVSKGIWHPARNEVWADPVFE
jgi:hypothetical protein